MYAIPPGNDMRRSIHAHSQLRVRVRPSALLAADLGPVGGKYKTQNPAYILSKSVLRAPRQGAAGIFIFARFKTRGSRLRSSYSGETIHRRTREFAGRGSGENIGLRKKRMRFPGCMPSENVLMFASVFLIGSCCPFLVNYILLQEKITGNAGGLRGDHWIYNPE